MQYRVECKLWQQMVTPWPGIIGKYSKHSEWNTILYKHSRHIWNIEGARVNLGKSPTKQMLLNSLLNSMESSLWR